MKIGGKNMANDKDIITKTNDGYVVELFTKAATKKEIQGPEEGLTIIKPGKSLVEEDLYEEYKQIVEKMEDKPVIIKTPEMESETMVLKTQLRAMLRASKLGDLSIIFPKIASVIELREYNELLEECKKELELVNTPYKKHMKVGIVVEIPSVALMSYGLAKECDFFFIETNSLINYIFGNKKRNEKIPNLYTTFQPAMIKLIKQAIEGAHDAGIFCGICGDIVENELYMPLLIGLGIDQFSIEANNVEKLRRVISELDKYDCKELVEEILQIRTIEEVENRLKQFKRS